jgi:hypothetical protein
MAARRGETALDFRPIANVQLVNLNPCAALTTTDRYLRIPAVHMFSAVILTGAETSAHPKPDC